MLTSQAVAVASRAAARCSPIPFATAVTGVTLTIMARVNSSGIVTMVIQPERERAAAAAATSSIQSPSFSNRSFQRRSRCRTATRWRSAASSGESTMRSNLRECRSCTGIPIVGRGVRLEELQQEPDGADHLPDAAGDLRHQPDGGRDGRDPRHGEEASKVDKGAIAAATFGGAAAPRAQGAGAGEAAAPVPAVTGTAKWVALEPPAARHERLKSSQSISTTFPPPPSAAPAMYAEGGDCCVSLPPTLSR